jgi:hypothetical protein
LQQICIYFSIERHPLLDSFRLSLNVSIINSCALTDEAEGFLGDLDKILPRVDRLSHSKGGGARAIRCKKHANGAREHADWTGTAQTTKQRHPACVTPEKLKSSPAVAGRRTFSPSFPAVISPLACEKMPVEDRCLADWTLLDLLNAA